MNDSELQALIETGEAAKGFLVTSSCPAWLSWYPGAPRCRVDVGVYSEFGAISRSAPIAIEWRAEGDRINPEVVIGDEPPAAFLQSDVDQVLQTASSVEAVLEGLAQLGYRAVDNEAVTPAFPSQLDGLVEHALIPVLVPRSELVVAGPHAVRTIEFLKRVDAVVADLNALGVPAEDIRDQATIYSYDQNLELAEYALIERKRAEAVGGAAFDVLTKLCCATGFWLFEAGDEAERALQLTGLAESLPEAPDGHSIIPLPYPIDSVEFRVCAATVRSASHAAAYRRRGAPLQTPSRPARASCKPRSH